MGDTGCAGLIIGALIWGFIGGAIGWDAKEVRMQREAVRVGAAHYDPKTAEFKWGAAQ